MGEWVRGQFNKTEWAKGREGERAKKQYASSPFRPLARSPFRFFFSPRRPVAHSPSRYRFPAHLPQIAGCSGTLPTVSLYIQHLPHLAPFAGPAAILSPLTASLAYAPSGAADSGAISTEETMKMKARSS
jgi:hypothetical protein